jgi:hypothetical protein
MILALILVALFTVQAQAQITINFLDRTAWCELVPQAGSQMNWGEGTGEPGPWLRDLDIVEGSHHMRSVHDSEVVVDGPNLTVSGSYLGQVSSDDQPSIHAASAGANLLVMFVPADQSEISIEATVPAGGEAYCFDFSDNDFGFDFAGPGTVTLDETLVPGHEYLFQIFYSVGVYDEGPAQAERSAAFTMTVVPDPVAVTETTWGSMKVLFR